MNIKKMILPFFLLFLLTFTVNNGQSTSLINYKESNDIISNPERGFSVYRDFQVTVGYVNNLKPYNVTVIQRIYTIPQFINSELSADFLKTVQSDLNAARQGGAKLVMRFSYTDNQNGADAPLNIVLTHIAQLKPIFQANYDVIAYVETGFIGAWGEWYYSTNHLNNTNDRRTILFALLDALPTQRCAVVRTPDYKRQIFQNDNPLTITEAFDGTRRARTGAHNDCFLASPTDYGTYLDNDIEGDKTYLNLDNRFLPQGGETCNPSQFSGCGVAPFDMERMHWSVLNRDYHPTVVNGWKSGGCYDDINRRLGYRFVLLDGEFSNQVKPGDELSLNLKLKNIGFSSPFNPRSVEFILRNLNSGAKYRMISDEDPRYWFSGDTVSVSITAGIHSNMTEGNYELLMHLADPEPALHDRPEYSIRLANDSLWEDTTGYNKLNHNVEINSAALGNEYQGGTYFSLVSNNTTEPPLIKIDGIFDDWTPVGNLDLSPNIESAGDALNPSTDIVDMWITDDEDNIYISYSLDSAFADQYFYHVFFDADNDTSTGFHSGKSYSGIDLMIENDQLWKYNGQNGEWSWTSFGSFASSIGIVNKKRIEISISKNTLSQAGSVGTIQIIFNVNNNDALVDDDYAPNAYKERGFTYSYLITSVNESLNGSIPEKYKITAYPNPFNNSVNISFNVKTNLIRSAGIFDALGRKIKSYSVENITNQRILWNGINDLGDNVGSGIYFFQLMTDRKLLTQKIVLLK